MFTSLLLGGTLALGQPPVVVQPQQVVSPVIGQPFQVPAVQPSAPAPQRAGSITAGFAEPAAWSPPAPPQQQIPYTGYTAVPVQPRAGGMYPEALFGSQPPGSGLWVVNNGLPSLQDNGKSGKAQDDPVTSKNDKDDKKDDKKPDKPKEKKWIGEQMKLEDETSTFWRRLYTAYYNQWYPPENKPEEQPLPRRAMPSPWLAPPFPGDEYQGYPLVGVPWQYGNTPVMQALNGGPYGDWIKESRITFEGWATMEGNVSNAKNSNVPTSYWVRPNAVDLDQLVFKFERVPDTVQQDHWDWGFRAIALYGEDYRYTTGGGYGSDQLLKHNLYYGWDPTELYGNVYIPGFLGGTDIRVGRWIACPDIETQYSVNNYMGSHSILFTYDTYTNSGIMVTQKINDQWMVQLALTAGTDMAPWYPGAIPTFGAGVRWVSKDNNDSVYIWLNQCNDAQFRHFDEYGQPLGHDNFNYIVGTWTHKFSDAIHTSTEAYYMWQYNAELGGTPSAGPIQPYGGGGGDGVLLPGLSRAYGILNYTMFGLSDRDYITVRNEWYRDERGMRTGVPGNYTSHTIGLSHQFNDTVMLRPEIGFYRNWTNDAFDGGTKRNLLLAGFDLTFRF